MVDNIDFVRFVCFELFISFGIILVLLGYLFLVRVEAEKLFRVYLFQLITFIFIFLGLTLVDS